MFSLQDASAPGHRHGAVGIAEHFVCGLCLQVGCQRISLGESGHLCRNLEGGVPVNWAEVSRFQAGIHWPPDVKHHGIYCRATFSML